MNPLSLCSINEHSPYRVVVSDGGDYLFSTKHGIVYSVSFCEEFELGGCICYQFSLTNVNDKHSYYDSDIRPTVIAIIKEFFTNNQNVLLYMCDTTDGREAHRNRLFLRWFKESDTLGQFTIKTANAKVEDQTLYVAIIVENNNPKIEEITNSFEAEAEMLTNKPN